MGLNISKEYILSGITGKLERHFGVGPKTAKKEQVYKACALIVRDILMEKRLETQQRTEREKKKQVYYMSMEFLIGRSLRNNLYNLGLNDMFSEVLDSMGFELDEIYNVETDAGLGNGGLGRLAACYMDSLASLGIPTCGFSILYEYGIFRQRIVDGAQVELPDNWLDTGESWLVPKIDETFEVHFGGELKEHWDEKGLIVEHTNYSTVLAVPYDMLISGYDSQTVNALRLWSAKSPYTIDMALFGKGEYVRAMEQKSLAEVISKVLYPEDDHYEGKSLRLKQQYFFVSATMQYITKKHFARYGTLDNLSDKIVIHINDTHPALCIPELMRILIDDYHYGWDKAWGIVTSCVAYTNHTVMTEALERWPRQLFSTLLPRMDQIVNEINERLCHFLFDYFNGDWGKVSDMAILANNEVRMANLCVAGAFSVNGVSELHSEIIKDKVFSDYYRVMPHKFTNVTNGIAHRRWLYQSNPGLAGLISDCIGDEYLKEPERLADFAAFCDDAGVQSRFERIKLANKQRMAAYVASISGVELDPGAIFDVQVKRLHEYKRQLLNVMHILHMYYVIQDNPNIDIVPRVYMFGAKASAGYYMAKQIIKLIHSTSSMVNNDPAVSKYMKVIFLEDYCVTLAERLMPASNVSEQISVAGKEASGTGNMKFMMNGALTLGTMDGANVEIAEAVGDENIFIFGLRADEVDAMHTARSYSPLAIYNDNSYVRRVLDTIRGGLGHGVLHMAYPDITDALLLGNGGMADTYMLLADFDSYCAAHDRVDAAYRDRSAWNRSAIINVARSGRFAADRAVGEYARDIWHVTPDNGR